ncbi:DUF6702 family protein [Emcibacter nanhaiensis]|uniref:Uncharacterized protein n=1 Tax=Emcibacter nanhaiensis TaxID=1505037 RepID=A0A501PNH3_9PROT|nr:DUF6702 family protein [Emcibacter nanhaiensis]TPD61983.1 hypothetical protein FIV46_07225 [Emcibacter nanhaiensis]
MRRLLLSLIAILVLVSGGQALAHRFAASFTVVQLREDKGAIQVTHRLFTHDVEDLIRTHSAVGGGELTDDNISSFLKDYVGSSFALYDGNGERIDLKWVGYEYTVEDIHVYQEVPLPDGLKQIGVIDRILTETFPDQVNRVNIEKSDKVQTLIFRKGDGLKIADIDSK